MAIDFDWHATVLLQFEKACVPFLSEVDYKKWVGSIKDTHKAPPTVESMRSWLGYDWSNVYVFLGSPLVVKARLAHFKEFITNHGALTPTEYVETSNEDPLLPPLSIVKSLFVSWEDAMHICSTPAKGITPPPHLEVDLLSESKGNYLNTFKIFDKNPHISLTKYAQKLKDGGLPSVESLKIFAAREGFDPTWEGVLRLMAHVNKKILDESIMKHRVSKNKKLSQDDTAQAVADFYKVYPQFSMRKYDLWAKEKERPTSATVKKHFGPHWNNVIPNVRAYMQGIN